MADSPKPTRTDIDAPISREDAEQASRTHSQEIPGRDFAGVKRAADQQEQTLDRLGRSRKHVMDDTGSDRGDEGAPRDES